jgi:hypothetical protein
MADLYRFLSVYEGLIYIFLLIAAMFAGRTVWRAWRETQAAIFGLEREISRRKLISALAGVLVILVLFVGVFVTVTFVLPGWSAAVIVPTATVNPLTVPYGTLLPETATALAQARPDETRAASGCIFGRLDLTSPRSGEEVQGTVELKGSVDIPNFGFYKYEISPAGSDIWATISAARVPVRDGPLGLWTTSQLTPGDYQLRLVVTDNQGLVLPACVITVRVMGN